MKMNTLAFVLLSALAGRCFSQISNVNIHDSNSQIINLTHRRIVPADGFLVPASLASPAEASVTLSAALDFWIGNTEKEVVSAAEAMPEDKYAFAPTGGEFTGVRTFAQQVKHLAANNYRMAAWILGQPATPDQEAEIGPHAVQSKTEILDYLKGSFAALHRSVATITPENAVTPVFPARIGAGRQNTRVQFAVDAVTHSYDHYGQMVEYLRMNGIIPPASRR